MKFNILIEDKTYSIDAFMRLPTELSWLKSIRHFLRNWEEQSWIDCRTSGSTGIPKKIRFTKNDMLASAAMTLHFLNIQKGEIGLLCLPVEFIGGKMMLVRAIQGDLNLMVIEANANPLLNLEREIDFLSITPHQLGHILKSPTSVKKLKKIRNVIVGGGPVNAETARIIRSYPNKIWSTFGMTETISHFAMSLVNSTHPEVYELISDQFSIHLDAESRLVIKTPYSGGKTLYTNDLIEMLDEKSFIWKGRHDNVINSGGIKHSPEEIEKKIKSWIADPFIIGSKPDKHLGQAMVLIIESNNGANYLTEEFRSTISKVLKKYEIPKEIILMDKFKRIGNDKIDRKSIVP